MTSLKRCYISKLMTDDQHFITLIQQGNTAACKVIVDRYSAYVMSICMQILKNREEAEEVAQDTFVKAFKSLDSFNGTSKFRTWLYQIAYRTSIDCYRRRKRVESIDEPHYGNIAAQNSSMDNLDCQDLRNQINKVLDMMNEEEAVMIKMFYFEEMNVKELCEILDMTDSNVKIKLFRARKKLKNLLKSHLNNELKEFVNEK